MNIAAILYCSIGWGSCNRLTKHFEFGFKNTKKRTVLYLETLWVFRNGHRGTICEKF